MQHVVVCHDLLPMLLLGFSHDKVSLVAIVFFSSAYSFYCDRVSSIATILCVVTGIFMLRHQQLCCDNVSCAASSNWCRDLVFMSRQHFCLVLVATMFLVLLAFLSRAGKYVATESCRHLS